MKRVIVVSMVLVLVSVVQANVWVEYDDFDNQQSIDPMRWQSYFSPNTSAYIDQQSGVAKLFSMNNVGDGHIELLITEDVLGVKADMWIENSFEPPSYGELLLEISLGAEVKAVMGLVQDDVGEVHGVGHLISPTLNYTFTVANFQTDFNQPHNFGITLENTLEVGFYLDNILLAKVPHPNISFEDAGFKMMAEDGFAFGAIDNVQVIPEPMSFTLLSLGGLIVSRLKKRQ